MEITIVGTGYVGLVSGTCLAYAGHIVNCVDIDADKVDRLKSGEIPIYEPGLQELVEENVLAGRLHFTTALSECLQKSEAVFIAVGTPPRPDGSADLSAVLGVAGEIGDSIQHSLVVINKSTVPVGTADLVRQTILDRLSAREASIDFEVVSNPEFLKEGSAIKDFLNPDRIVVGCEDAWSRNVLEKIYAPFTSQGFRIIWMGVRDAEMTKYAANALLATKISFMNEIARLCELLGADVDQVRHGVGSDPRIGTSFISPGCGYGGSCFPKDVRALIDMGEKQGFETAILKAVDERNQKQKLRLGELVFERFGGNLSAHIFAVWGLAFKPGTDDMRDAPSIDLIRSITIAGGSVRVYDPVAMATAARALQVANIDFGKVTFCEKPYEALDGASALILVTEWQTLAKPDFSEIAARLDSKIIFDGRNQYPPHELASLGFQYRGIGRKPL